MTAAPDPLRARCECGEYGKGLSLCKACGAFISMTLSAQPDPDDESVRAAYEAYLMERCAGEMLLNKETLLTACEKQLYWTDFLSDMAKRNQ